MHLELRNKVLSPLEKGSRRGFVFADLSDYPLNIKRHRALATDRFSLRLSELAILKACSGQKTDNPFMRLDPALFHQ
jgi:hypothetical protein